MAGNGADGRRRSQPVGISAWKWRGISLALAVVLLLTGCALREDIPLLERRAQQLNKAIMCPVCPGESIDQSQNPLAVQMRVIVTEKLEQGSTEQEIQQFFVERYGPSVLLEPVRRGFTLVVWLLPPVVLFGAGIALYLALRLMRRSPAPAPQGVGDEDLLSDAERQDYIRRIEASLDDDSSAGTHVIRDLAPPSVNRRGD